MKATESDRATKSRCVVRDVAASDSTSAQAASTASPVVDRAISDTSSPTSVPLSTIGATARSSRSGASGSRHRQSACLRASASACAELPPTKISGADRASETNGVFTRPSSTL